MQVSCQDSRPSSSQQQCPAPSVPPSLLCHVLALTLPLPLTHSPCQLHVELEVLVHLTQQLHTKGLHNPADTLQQVPHLWLLQAHRYIEAQKIGAGQEGGRRVTTGQEQPQPVQPFRLVKHTYANVLKMFSTEQCRRPGPLLDGLDAAALQQYLTPRLLAPRLQAADSQNPTQDSTAQLTSMKQLVPAFLVTYPNASSRMSFAPPFLHRLRREASVNFQPSSLNGLMSI